VIIDVNIDERLGAREACDPGTPPQADVPEPTLDALVVGVDPTGVCDADRGFVSIFRADAVGFDQHGSAARRQPMQRVQQRGGSRLGGGSRSSRRGRSARRVDPIRTRPSADTRRPSRAGDEWRGSPRRRQSSTPHRDATQSRYCSLSTATILSAPRCSARHV